MSSRRSGVQHRLARVYIFQVALISLATVLGVLVTALITERVLVERALKLEAEYFWKLHEQDPDQPQPNTRHLIGYLVGPERHDPVPGAYRGREPGFHRLEVNGERPIIYIEERGEYRLYLEFDEERVFALALVFGIVPLIGVLLVIYLLTYLGWRRSRQLVSPLVRLADALRDTRFDTENLDPPDLSGIRAEQDSEVAVLVSALETYAQRLLEFVERERQFTRDASHELRTPLAVIRANLELLAARFPESRPLRRIEDTAEDMEGVIETLLMLSRVENREPPAERLVVNDLVVNLIERLDPLARRKQVDLQCRQDAMLEMEVSENVLRIVLTNLLRNAINYTESGSVEVIIGRRSLTVCDSGPGMEPEAMERLMKPFERGENGEPGHGLGLAIVQRLCERCGWKLQVASSPGHGTRVRVVFALWQLVEARLDSH